MVEEEEFRRTTTVAQDTGGIMRLGRKLVMAAGIALWMWLALAGVAMARPLVHEHFHDASSEVIEEFCGDLTVREDIDVRGQTLINSRGPNGLPYFHETVRGSLSWTNLANGKTMYQVFTINDKDLKVTDNGDGTLTILVLNTGGFRLYGPDGQRLRDSGQIRFELLIDHGGTPTDPSDDEFLEFLGIVKESTGTNELEGHDFCEDIHDFIG
ncbi:hypothetical protein BH18ACT5_BH18ACT5_04740 [soil metagenome]